MKKLLVVLAVSGLAGIAFAGEHPGKGMEHAGQPVDNKSAAKTSVIKPSKANWQPMGDPKGGPWMSVVQGDPQKGAFTMYLKMKAGGESPWHTHDTDYSAVVVEGTATHQDQGGELLKANPGEAWTSKGGVNHQNKCMGKKDCVVFVSMNGPLTFTMMTADGKKMEMPAAAPAGK